MAQVQGTYGRLSVFEDFLGFETTTMSTTALPIGAQGVNYVSTNEGSFATTVDEPGGIVAITLDTDARDNCALYIGPFKPADGGVVMEARLKISALSDLRLFVGFTETLDATTPIVPAMMSTVTMTYNGSGGMVGLMCDYDQTTLAWTALAGDGGAVSGDAAANGTATDAPVADEWDLIRVEIDVDGHGRVYHDGKLIKDVGIAVTPADLQFAVVVAEQVAASGTAVTEVDYFMARGWRDWTLT